LRVGPPAGDHRVATDDDGRDDEFINVVLSIGRLVRTPVASSVESQGCGQGTSAARPGAVFDRLLDGSTTRSSCDVAASPTVASEYHLTQRGRASETARRACELLFQGGSSWVR